MISPVDPASVTNVEELIAGLNALKQFSGNASFSELEARTGIPKSTLADLLNKQKIPRDDLLYRYVRGCGFDHHEAQKWINASIRVNASRHGVAGRKPVIGKPVIVQKTRRIRSQPSDLPKNGDPPRSGDSLLRRLRLGLFR
jgi:hypothetical protein